MKQRMPRVLLVLFNFLLFASISCSPFTPRQLVKLPMSGSPNSLESAQAQAIFDRAQYFPNGTQLSIGILLGDSESAGETR